MRINRPSRFHSFNSLRKQWSPRHNSCRRTGKQRRSVQSTRFGVPALRRGAMFIGS